MSKIGGMVAKKLSAWKLWTDMYVFWAKIGLIKYSWPYRGQLQEFGQPFHLAWPRIIFSILKSFGTEGILVIGNIDRAEYKHFTSLYTIIGWGCLNCSE